MDCRVSRTSGLQTKMHFFFKKGELEGKTASVYGIGTNGMEEDIREGCKGINVVEILCTHV
jgi:hypothetical protein